MAKSICRDFAFHWEREQISKYPEIEVFIEKLKIIIKENPDGGKPDPIVFNGKKLLCKRHAVKIELFPRHNAMGYSFLVADYLCEGDDIYIIGMNYF